MLLSWLSVPETSEFSLQNLPYGVFSSVGSTHRRCATVLGETVLDLSLLEEAGLFDDVATPGIFRGPTLNPFLACQPTVWQAVRRRLVDLLDVASQDRRLRDNGKLQKAVLHELSGVTLYLPIQIGDYTDFYSSREHATNVGTMFRGKDNALQPNWLHLPVGYHGRVSTIHVTGHSFPRPRGQLQKNADKPQEGSTYGPSRLLDFELEVAAVVGGPPNAAPMDIDQAKSRIFGYMLMNDWSARDIQKWEYVPLGPFTSKNFATTVSAWIVPADSLEAFRIPTSAGTQSNPEPLDYLKDANYSSFDIRLSVAIQPPKSPTPHIVSRSNFRHLYWNPAQQLVHHSVTGCIMKAGDLLGSGTISGTEPSSFGSLLELSWKGTKEIPVGDEVRKFLKDGDTVLMRGCCEKEGYGRVGFGECLASVLPPAEKPSNSIGESVLPRYTNFKLYGYWRSSSTWRVRMVLEFKGITHETVPINLVNFEHREAAYLELNKFGQVPLLECLDTEEKKIVRVSQSLAIAEFLEEVTPGRRSIIPRDAVQRARIREMAEIVNAGIQPLQNLFHVKRLEELSGGSISATEEAKLAISRGLACLEALAIECQSESSGPYVGGTFAPSLADFCVLPQIANARRFGVDVEAVCPTLLTSETVCRSESWYESSHPEQQPGAPTRQSAKKLV